MFMDKETSVRADDIQHVLRDGVAYLPGCRDRHGHPLIVFPSREASVNPDHVRNVLLYLREVCADEARDRGFMIVIDMRGKQTWTNVKPMLKAINCLVDSGAAIAGVFLINPDKLGEKLKTQISSGFCKFEMHKISVETLTKYFEPNQLIRELGGCFYYDHDEWLETRIELELWIGSIIQEMRKLESHRRQIRESESPVDVTTAQAAIERHQSLKKGVLAVPIDVIQKQAQKVQERVLNTGRSPNPDLEAALPNLSNLVASLQQLKNDVYKLWENRRLELETTVQLKVFERDADDLLNWVRVEKDRLERSIGDIGTNELEATERLRRFEELARSAETREEIRNNIASLAARISNSLGPMRNRVEIAAQRVDDEWIHLIDLLTKRRNLLSVAISFYKAAQVYSIEVPGWLELPGIDPACVSNEHLDEAIEKHEKFWDSVEGVYAEAISQGSQLTQAQRACGLSDTALGCGVPKEQLAALHRAHKELHALWHERKVRLHSMLALTAFRTDTQLVVKWLEQHGEPYLERTVGIGSSQEEAKALHASHHTFRKIATNTYVNAEKLFAASRAIQQSGVSDGNRTLLVMSELADRINRFKERAEERWEILNKALLFHTHCAELIAWYAQMEERFNERAIETDVDKCELHKQRWLVEMDGTSQAYATTITEGKKLLSVLAAHGKKYNIDYASTLNMINRLLGEMDSGNGHIMEQWQATRILLQIGTKYANFVFDVKAVLPQFAAWEEDMEAMLRSATFIRNAETVRPFHKDNTNQVKAAVASHRISAQELLQALTKPEWRDLRTTSGQNVLEEVEKLLHGLNTAEARIMGVAQQTLDRIDAARKYMALSNIADEMIEKFHQEAAKLMDAPIPRDANSATLMSLENEKFKKTIEDENAKSSQHFSDLKQELYRNSAIDRNLITGLSEKVLSSWRAIAAAIQERGKLLKAAQVCYKTFENFAPILANMERDYAKSHDVDDCMQWLSEPMDLKAERVAGLITRHNEHKHKFAEGCNYSAKSATVFLKYIERQRMASTSPVTTTALAQHEEALIATREALRLRQIRVLELWNRRKKQLDRCQRFVLTDAACQLSTSWLQGEGEADLARYCRHARANLSDAERTSILEDFKTFKLKVKNRRNDIRTTLNVARDVVESDKTTTQHVADIDRCTQEMRIKFEDFSRRVIACEDALRGDGKAGMKDELSLDRHSDSNVEEALIVRREIDSRIRDPMCELLRSERFYVDDLERCCEVYLAEYNKAAAARTLPAALVDRRYDIFGNILKVRDFHARSFLPDVLKYEDDPEQVGCCFTLYVDLINDIYTEYCVNKEQNNHVLDMPECKAFFKEVQSRHGLDIKDDLGSLLIKPIQRITRYRLMLEQLMKHCTGNMDEFKEAHEIVVGVPRRANDLMHVKCLEKKNTVLEHVGAFVMQDTLTVWEPRQYFKGRGKERQVFLFEMAMVIAKRIDVAPSKTEDRYVKGIKYIIKGKPIQLNEINVVEHLDVNDSKRFGIRIGEFHSNENRVDLRAGSETQKNVWVRRIRELVQGLYKPMFGSAFSAPIKATAKTSQDNKNIRDSENPISTEQRFSVQSTSSTEEALPTTTESQAVKDPMDTRRHQLPQIKSLAPLSANGAVSSNDIQRKDDTNNDSHLPPDISTLQLSAM